MSQARDAVIEKRGKLVCFDWHLSVMILLLFDQFEGCFITQTMKGRDKSSLCISSISSITIETFSYSDRTEDRLILLSFVVLGVVFVKENVPGRGFVLDKIDSSVTRSRLQYEDKFRQCGLKVSCLT